MLHTEYYLIRWWRDTYNKFIFFSVDDDGCDLLVHEDENNSKQGRRQSGKQPVPFIGKRIHNPPASCQQCRLQKQTLKHFTPTILVRQHKSGQTDKTNQFFT